MATEYEDDFEDYQDDFEDEPAVVAIVKPAPAPAPAPAPVPAAKQAVTAVASTVREELQTATVQFASLPTSKGIKLRTQDVQVSMDPYEEAFDTMPASLFDLYQSRVKLGVVRQSACQVVERRVDMAIQSDIADKADVASQVPEDLGFSKVDVSALSGGSKNAADPEFPQRAVKFVEQAGLVIERICEENLLDLEACPTGAAKPRDLVVQFTTVRTAAADNKLLSGRQILCSTVSPIRSSDVATAFGTQSSTPAGASIDAKYATASIITVSSGWSDRESKTRFVLVCYGTPTALCFSNEGDYLVAGTAEGALQLWSLEEPNYLHPTQYGVSSDGKDTPLQITSGLRLPSYTSNNPTFNLLDVPLDPLAALRKHGAAIRSVVRVGAGSTLYRGFLSVLSEDPNAGKKNDLAPLDDEIHDDTRFSEHKTSSRARPVRPLPSAGAGLASLLTAAASETAITSAAAGTVQFASVDDLGQLDVWVVVALPSTRGNPLQKGGAAAGTWLSAMIDESDLGKSASSSCKLSRVATLQVADSHRGRHADTSLTPLAIFDLDVCPSDPTRYLVACSDGKVRHITRSGTAPVPSVFFPPNDYESNPSLLLSSTSPIVLSNAAVVTLQFNTFLPNFFLAGLSDGNIALYTTGHAMALRTWHTPWAGVSRTTAAQQAPGASVARLRWLPTRPAAFACVDEFGWLCVWDLLVSSGGPIHSQQLSPSWGSAANATGAACSVVSFEIQGGSDVSPRSTTIICGFSNGSSVVVSLAPAFCCPRRGETTLARRAFIA